MSDNEKATEQMLLGPETDFGLNILSSLPQNESVVFSPLSIALALSLVHAGAKGNTKDEIRNAVLKGSTDEQFVEHFTTVTKLVEDSQKGVKTDVANRIYAREKFEILQSYLDTVHKDFNATAETLDFDNGTEAAEIVNKFVSDTTEGKISNLVQPAAFQDALALIINAVYFKGKWMSPFSKDSTRDENFSTSENDVKSLPFMPESRVWKDYASDDHFEVLSLPYKDESYSFAIFLPKQKYGLADALTKLDGCGFQSLLDNLTRTYVNLMIPKMKIEQQIGLKETLNDVGIKQVFSNAADMSAMAADVKVSDGIHKALIEVDEEGTTAAAASVIRMVPLSAIMKDPIVFVADHPFLYALLKDNHPLFMGVFFG